MKPASIISLIIAVLLMVVGLVTCFIAQNIARDNGESLFSKQPDGSYRVEETLKDDTVKIELIDLSNVKINIYGNCDSEDSAHYSETARIEFINFKENFYNLTYGGTTLSFDQILPNITSLAKSLISGGSFKGMRYYLNPDQLREFLKKEETEDDGKRIDIYLTSHVKKINNIKIGTSGDCEILIDNVESGADFDITADRLKLTVTNTETSGHLYVNNLAKDTDKPAKSLDLTVTRSAFDSLVLNADEMTVNAVGLDLHIKPDNTGNGMKLTCEAGDLRIGMQKPLLSSYNIEEILASGQHLIVEGNYENSPYTKLAASGLPFIIISGGKADVEIYGNTQAALASAAATEAENGG